LLHEQNAIAGKTNLWLARLTANQLEGFPGALPQGQWVGNPVRQQMTQLPAPQTRYAQRHGSLRLLVVGGSLGAAALKYGKRLQWKHPYLGTEIAGDYPVEQIIEELVTKKIAGVASGRAEFGPRALGNRSLLADPRGNDIKDRVNEIKRRQKFRPFAPAILEEHVHDYFAMPDNMLTSPYMQTVAKVLDPAGFPAITHIDGTARVQTVADDGSGFRQLLEAWYDKTGCPMLLNTSLNIKGEPMVDDRADADRFEERYNVKVCS